jgi:hypothetical protein
MGIEALFWGKEVICFGDSPVSAYFSLPDQEREPFLSWFFLCYLMPYRQLFDLDYYEWRLSGVRPHEIALRHLDVYLQNKQLWETGSPHFPVLSDQLMQIEVDGPGPTVRKLADVDELRAYVQHLESDIDSIRSDAVRLFDENTALGDQIFRSLSEINALRQRLERPWREIWNGVLSRFVR